MADEPGKKLGLVSKSVNSLSKPLPLPKNDQKVVDAEWVVYRVQQKGRWLRWLAAGIQILTALLISWILFIIPLDPSVGPFSNWKNPVIILILICFIGKTLVDTFFFDHYQP